MAVPRRTSTQSLASVPSAAIGIRGAGIEQAATPCDDTRLDAVVEPRASGFGGGVARGVPSVRTRIDDGVRRVARESERDLRAEYAGQEDQMTHSHGNPVTIVGVSCGGPLVPLPIWPKRFSPQQ